ncbi:high-potential iron-sulfur protein [Adhaeribacter radiodurans]|uniref:High-potential iron-sulfur protein n=1 Tax=Adhaeribacter radiodurans TaxID=2745197 RepID=A0A7L7LAW7_9BACT|nr:high-potential iron-sulfur protein [Adhaeribacter radiodurans]QMU29695.1 high-potential iron-sulfur protein [Adhaeribacter radiodurans]
MNKKYTRREFLFKNIAGSAAFITGGWLLTSFKVSQTHPQTTNQAKSKDSVQQTPKSISQNPCEDLSGIASGEIEKRKKFAYVTISPNPDSRCGNCKLFLPPAAGKPCGACLLFKGTVQESGYCTYWAPLE